MENMDEQIEKYRGIVYAQLKALHLSYDEDATSIGLIALHKAISTFEHNKGAKLSTYATTCVYNALGGYLRNQKTQMMTCTSSYDITLPEGNAIVDLIADTVDVAKAYEATDSVNHINNIVETTYNKLGNATARAVVRTWIDNNYTQTFKELSELHGCSISYASNIIQAFRRTLKTKLSNEGLMED